MKSLLVVSADREADLERVASGRAPRRDYLELACHLNADILDAGSVARGRDRLTAAALLAARVRSVCRDYDVVFTDNEQLGALVALALRSVRRRPRHVLLAHHLTPPKKRMPLQLARPAVDTIVVHAEQQRSIALGLGYAPEQVVTLPYQVDADFWRPQTRDVGAPMVCTAGLECRDYPTLVAAACDLNVEVRIGAASHWSRKRSTLTGVPLPDSVTVRSYDYNELRDLYAASRFVVVPLFDVDFQAGITLVLEAMAMGKAVIMSNTAGNTGAVRGPLWGTFDLYAWPEGGPSIEESNGFLVPPGDSYSLKAAMSFLLDNPEVADRLGRNGRALVESEFTVEAFAHRFAAVIAGKTSDTRFATTAGSHRH